MNNANTSKNLLLSEVISALSYALDLTEGQPSGHSVRCCWIGTYLAKSQGLAEKEIWDIYYTLLLKDIGCSSNAERLCELYGVDDRKVKQDYKFVNNESHLQLAKFVLTQTGLKSSAKKDRFQKILNFVFKGESIANNLITTRCERGANIALKLGFNASVANGVRNLDEHWNGKGCPLKKGKQDSTSVSNCAIGTSSRCFL